MKKSQNLLKTINMVIKVLERLLIRSPKKFKTIIKRKELIKNRRMS